MNIAIMEATSERWQSHKKVGSWVLESPLEESSIPYQSRIQIWTFPE